MVLEENWSLAAAAEAAGVSERTCSKWVGRYRSEGEDRLLDRSSAPRSVSHRTPDELVQVMAALRRLRMTGAEIAPRSPACASIGQGPSLGSTVVPAGMASKRDGVRAALPLLVPLVALGASFGVLARGLHWGAVAPVVMSIVLPSRRRAYAHSAGARPADGCPGATGRAGSTRLPAALASTARGL